MSKTYSILIICDTNVSLSPLFKSILAAVLRDAGIAEQLELLSAGTHAGNSPRPADFRAKAIAAEKGLVFPEHQSRGLTRQDLDAANLVVVMNEENFWFVKQLDPDIAADRLKLLMEFTLQLGLREMPDPLLGEIKYEEAYEVLEKAARSLCAYVRGQLALL